MKVKKKSRTTNCEIEKMNKNTNNNNEVFMTPCTVFKSRRLYLSLFLVICPFNG